MIEIQHQLLVYHLTSLENMPSILSLGLLPRSKLTTFTDVADPEILVERRRLKLEDRVPFHFFARNPFAGRVQMSNRSRRFVLIAVKRTVARDLHWKIIPRHPLAGADIQIMDYDQGFAAIDWTTMNKRTYADPRCKSTCMAECIAPTTVGASLFSNVFVRESTYADMRHMVAAAGLTMHVNVNEKMFLK